MSVRPRLQYLMEYLTELLKVSPTFSYATLLGFYYPSVCPFNRIHTGWFHNISHTVGRLGGLTWGDDQPHHLPHMTKRGGHHQTL
jgi:hypothetical protein